MVDAVEGVMMHTETVVKQALHEGLTITLCINKVGGSAAVSIICHLGSLVEGLRQAFHKGFNR